MDKKHETKFIITIKTDNSLSEKEKFATMDDFKWRIQGYTTEPLKFLGGSDMTIHHDED